uniref:N-acylneuraminate cytidylyltransferase n=1 Tax=Noctiluca scintillans TaxID=2966 RepID=A0A7S1FIL3_NOCSC|mmetsp:Transcript_7364/g.20147  ORF Transcript_7364/g.20147 Transcript_7364/m.20147 type:complete len:234 (+) Transcript_7364:61-762(+)
MSHPRVVAVIPARGGSVSVPLKNIKELAGRPLIDWSIRAALDSGVFTEVYVSTDHDGIAEVALESGAKVHRRAPETATNTASTELALIDFADAHSDFDILCLIQATSPLVVPDHFQKALELFERQQADSLVTAVRAHRFLWSVDEVTGEARAGNYDPIKRPRRQDWNGELIENGAFYFTRKPLFDETQCRLGGKIALYEMPEHTLCELDSSVDWEILKNLAQAYGYHGKDGPK